MKLSQSGKFWAIFVLIIVAAFIGGILGNWVFIYLLDKYYGIPGGNYLAAPTSSPIIFRDAKTIAEQDNRITQTIAAIDSSLVKIFKKTSATNGVYEPQDATTTGFVMTSDGWLIAPVKLNPAKNGSFEEYEAITNDRKRFVIEKAFFDPAMGISFIRLSHAQNLSVRNFIFKRELSTGQTLLSSGVDASIEIARLSRPSSVFPLSDSAPITLTVSGFSPRPAYFFDAAGQMIGLNQGKMILAMDSIENVLEKILTDSRIIHPRLGVRYINLSESFAHGTDTGALLTAVDKNNPAIIAGSPAEKIGLRAGDIIAAIDDVTLNDFNDLNVLVHEYHPGDTIILTVRRGQETKKLSVTLDELPVK
jgi:hypothetical protein